MLNRELLRNEPERVRKGSEAKGEPCPIEEWLKLDEERRNLLSETETLRRRRNELSHEVSSLKKDGASVSRQIAESKEVGKSLGRIEKRLQDFEAEMASLELRFPNLPDPDVPIGKDESANELIRTAGSRPEFIFTPLTHWEILGNHLDSEASILTTGSNFIVLRGWAARLQRVLISWMMDFHTESGMEEIWTPFLASRESMTTTGQIPKLEYDMYHVEKNDLFLIPTGEVTLTNLYRGKILKEADLPVRIFGYTPCFRREAGSYGKDTRGLNRIHQFEKVEMVRFEHPDRSEEALEEMVLHVEKMLGLLELPYRISLLATGDLGFAAAKCYDFEVWSAGQEKWLEVSSISNFRDFQSRRGKIRFKPSGGGKPQFVHTLNGSGLALARLIAALVENGQTEDGRVKLPGVLAGRIGVDLLG